MPTPVSRTAKCAPHVSIDSRATVTSTLTSPRSVNLMPLPTRFRSTWRRRSASPTTQSGAPGAIRWTSSSPCWCARTASVRVASATTSARSNSTASSCSLPTSSFETSRMSLMTPSRPSALERSVARYSRCSGVSRRVGEQLRHPEDAVHRRPDLVAHVGEELALGAAAGLGGAARVGEHPAGAGHRSAGDERDDAGDGQRRQRRHPLQVRGQRDGLAPRTPRRGVASSWARCVSAAMAGAMRRA